MYIRYQTVIHLDDLHTEFLEAFVDAWNTQGLHAARCFGIGA